MKPIHHALVLNFHQPPANLDWLLEHNEWEAKEILFAMDRMPRALWDYEDIARVHLSLSGSLLETLASPLFQDRAYGIVKVGDLLWHLQNSKIFDILGTGYYHPVLPLIPENDWEEHMGRWQTIARHLFWRDTFNGFWPPEMGFCMEMIPHLRRMGYKYVLVDDIYIDPIDPMGWHDVRYRPHIAEFGGEEIVIVVRDRELSNAQLSGMDPGWFMNELEERTKNCDFEPLVTTCSDGDNGGWFRNHTDAANFWHVLYRPMLDAARAGETPVRPAYIHEYLEKHGPMGRVKVRTGAWNTENHYGDDFTQWTGTKEQKEALARMERVSDGFHEVLEQARATGKHPSGLDEAQWRILRAQTSCNYYWGSDWVWRVHQDLDEAESCLGMLA